MHTYSFSGVRVSSRMGRKVISPRTVATTGLCGVGVWLLWAVFCWLTSGHSASHTALLPLSSVSLQSDAAPRLISPQKNDVSDHQFKSVQFQVSPETERPKESQNVRPDNRSVWKTKPFSSVSFKLPETPEELFRAHDVSEEPSDLLDELYQRVKRVDDLCGKEHAKGSVRGVFTHDPSRAAYCFVPKAGCTFWIRVFSYLHKFTGQEVRSPWDIPRLILHNNPHSHGRPIQKVQQDLQDYLRFMFVRHPYSRLWSAYLDKLYLPDFWSQVGVHAVKKLRGNQTDALARKCGNDVTFSEFVEYSLGAHEPHWEPLYSLKCGNDVTFSEFVEYSLGAYEPHWEPLYSRCDPCRFRPNVIGHMDTFPRDSLFLLRRMGLEWVMKDMDQKEQTEKELTTLIVYNFNRVHSKAMRRFYQPCLRDVDLARRLWDTFQKNGYLPEDSAFPEPASGAVSAEELSRRVVETFRAAWSRRGQLRQQKRDSLRAAIASLSPELLEKVKAKYRQDMLYFGFDDSNY